MIVLLTKFETVYDTCPTFTIIGVYNNDDAADAAEIAYCKAKREIVGDDFEALMDSTEFIRQEFVVDDINPYKSVRL